MENPTDNVDPDQMPHSVASDLGLHCLPMIFYWFPVKNGLIFSSQKPMKMIITKHII